MLGLFVIAAALTGQAVQTVRIPPVAAPPPVMAPATPVTPVIEPVQSNTQLAARLLPDLVVKQIRIEGDSTIHVLVANEGTAAAGQFMVNAWANIASHRLVSPLRATVDSLAQGESKWVAIGGFYDDDAPTYPPPSPPQLSKATGVGAMADQPVGSLGWADPTKSFWPSPDKPKCNAERGCVVELHEDNNSLILSGDAIVRGKPD